MSGFANNSVSSGAAVQQGAPQNGNQGNGVCDRPGCTGHGNYEEKRSWNTWFWGQDHVATYNAQKDGVTKTEKPVPVDLMATNVPLTVGMSIGLDGRDVGAEASKMMGQLLDTAQTSLGAASILPVIGEVSDLLNTGISYLRGNYRDVAAYAAAAAIPFIGGTVIQKGADALGDVTKKADEVAEVGKDIAKNHAIQEALEKGDIHATKITRPPRHHLFPQEHRQWFKDRGIDIDKYTIELEQGVHEAIHKSEWAGNWNKELMQRLMKAEKAAKRQLTVGEIWDVMEGLRQEYKLLGDIISYH